MRPKNRSDNVKSNESVPLSPFFFRGQRGETHASPLGTKPSPSHAASVVEVGLPPEVVGGLEFSQQEVFAFDSSLAKLVDIQWHNSQLKATTIAN